MLKELPRSYTSNVTKISLEDFSNDEYVSESLEVDSVLSHRGRNEIKVSSHCGSESNIILSHRGMSFERKSRSHCDSSELEDWSARRTSPSRTKTKLNVEAKPFYCREPCKKLSTSVQRVDDDDVSYSTQQKLVELFETVYSSGSPTLTVAVSRFLSIK